MTGFVASHPAARLAMTNRVLTLSALAFLLAAATAAAQPAPHAARRQSIGASAQWMYSMSGESNFDGAAGLNVSWRYWTPSPLGIEAVFAWWKGVVHGGDDFVGSPWRFRYEDRVSAHSAAFNVLGRIPAGRAAIIVGGGPGYYRMRGRYQSEMDGRGYSSGGTSHDFGVQGLVELEVRATDWFSVAGGVRLELRDASHAMGGFTYPTVGARIAF
jgi:hypothetical protein